MDLSILVICTGQKGTDGVSWAMDRDVLYTRHTLTLRAMCRKGRERAETVAPRCLKLVQSVFSRC